MTAPSRARRWTTEQQVLSELERLNDLSMESAQEYALAAVEAAEAEATHKAARARRILTARAEGERSHAAAENVAEADAVVAEAYMARLVSAAQADAIRERLRSVRTNQDSLRTAAASHRTSFSGPGMQ